jgi:hypothetical protein
MGGITASPAVVARAVSVLLVEEEVAKRFAAT